MRTNYKFSFWLVSLSLLVLLLAACGRQAESPAATAAATAANTPTASATMTAAVVAAPDEPTLSPTPSLTPTATPIPTGLTIADQTVTDDGRILIAEIIAPEAGWLVIRTADGENGDILGVTAAPAGRSENLAILIDPLAAAPELTAVFHIDQGQSGVFEYPGPDIPWQNEQGEPLRLAFTVELAVTLPALVVADQDVGYDGQLVVSGVNNPVPVWLRLYADADGEPDILLGSRFLEPGEHENIPFLIDWRRATPQLHARLYADAGEAARFEPELDLPLTTRGRPIAAVFTIYLPPDVFVINQPLVNNSVTVERAISYGPGWIAVYRDENGQPDLIIGRAPLQDGVNERIVVTLAPASATSLLHIRLHEDTGEIGLFEFPREDAQLRYEGRLPDPFSFRIDLGSYLLTHDPAVWDDGRFILPLIVAEADMWLVIYADDDGERGDLLAHFPLTQGIHRQFAVELDLPNLPVTLHAVLHQDAGEPGEFEYPDGPDTPLARGRGVITVSFAVVAE